MEPITNIEITCQGATTVELDELNDLQGNLKDFTDTNYAKLRDSILTYGFSFPVFIWIDPQDNRKWIVDSHARKATLLRMRTEGITIPPLPADIIHAKDKNEAKQKLLLLNSQYGKMTPEGLYEFIHEPGLELDMTSIGDMLAIPLLDREEEAEEQAKGESESLEKAKHEVTCPNCQTKFVPS